MSTTTESLYEEITTTILGHLERGVVPWHQPWTIPGVAPQNLLSRKPYRGINPFLLNLQPFASPFWLTFRQARRLGGHVRKGERSTPIWFWKFYDKRREETDPETGEVRTALRRIPVLRRYRVFNATQCDGLEGRIPELPRDERTEWERIEAAEAIVRAMTEPPEIHHGMRGAFYRPSDDLVGMPDRRRFESSESYYSTLFHELAHATGHPRRLDREQASVIRRFDSRTYCREELVAEMAAAFLSARAGIAHATVEASAAYLDHWIRKLRGEPKLVMTAAGAAQKAADWILDTSRPADEEDRPPDPSTG